MKDALKIFRGHAENLRFLEKRRFFLSEKFTLLYEIVGFPYPEHSFLLFLFRVGLPSQKRSRFCGGNNSNEQCV